MLYGNIFNGMLLLILIINVLLACYTVLPSLESLLKPFFILFSHVRLFFISKALSLTGCRKTESASHVIAGFLAIVIGGLLKECSLSDSRQRDFEEAF
jgi:hypothetical protein